MKISEFIKHLNTLDHLNFQLENGTLVPAHIHVTEVGVRSKRFIDCGGVLREEKTAVLQLWYANDLTHRLAPKKLASIIKESEKQLEIDDLEIEIEYLTQTIGIYNLKFSDPVFVLMFKITDCLAPDFCGIKTEKKNQPLSQLTAPVSCKPGSGCC